MITINEVPLYTSCLFPSMPAAAKPKGIAGRVANPDLPTKKISLGPNLPLKTSLSCLSVIKCRLALLMDCKLADKLNFGHP